ncbi:hypothetical protein SAMN05443287_11128 [Micromonospora phaseoli]|uniref:Uncharacterized protein n=1 Tax=Micromonospora phaseoli TaxID=1144548 RepID=A0A1H7CY54_9ACTN|nr:hypothetical protein [Micromonospora phaseoli]PZV98013.1 hypothetical protein CLV64_105281 [Micromonospora phaseoli]GIJ81139.1 hypothetical protein Xph01_55710 [Micromonospora phaseoli]SEJ94426.1 hypothetical protein SAMN05443287_11128 [Micromonospora phaseoli]
MRRSLLAGLLVVLVAATGCTRGGADRPGAAEHVVAGQRLTENELHYGQAPRPHPKVTYQPDVVLVEAGAEAVRSVTVDGLTWTLDAAARGVSELTPGKVMFITSRGVGRVVAAGDAGDTRTVTIAPVELTDVIRDGEFASDQPVPIDEPIAYSAEGALWTDHDAVTAASPPSPGVRPAAFTGSPTAGAAAALPAVRRAPASPAPERVEMPRPSVGGKPVSANGFTTRPRCCRGGVGADITYDDGQIRFVASVMLAMQSPSARFRLAVSGGGISVAELQVYGGGGLDISIKGASTVGTDRQLDRRFTIPVDFTVPVGLVLGIPFTLSVSQEVLVKTAFSAKDGNLSAAGSYDLRGTLGFGYRDGGWGVHRPAGPVMRSSLVDSVKGISVGANGVVLAYKTTFTLGIGALGFKAGLHLGFSVSTGVARGSALAQFFPVAPGTRSIHCRGASLSIYLTYSVGYVIPEPVVKVVNFFLRIFQARPIASSGGIPKPPGRVKLFKKEQYEPAGCAA